ncbi:MAG: GDSL-type esterase/lipase family protein [Verrucomicrobiota bacterium]|nr:GDSL-type esterase/lipase family protein [Verrucomicrobiota bacterium]MDG1891563.1 GDSL-type esterase/lipase family protein [Verrucomicrobiota bacterium]
MASRSACILSLLWTLAWQPASSAVPLEPAAFTLEEGDRVVFLGNSFFERALDYGHLETSMMLHWKRRDITFRNLGWDGDTVYGHSRAGGRRRQVFGDPEEGFQRMLRHLTTLRPTVVFLAYGFNESFDGSAGIPSFRQGLKRLMDQIVRLEARLVILTPPQVPAGKASLHASLKLYADVMLEAAMEGGHRAIHLFGMDALNDPAFRENKLHLSKAGYRKVSDIIADALDFPPPILPMNTPAANIIRRAIVRKNTLYFHRWRPRNDAFVYGERKNEQQIAQEEPAQLEPLIAKQEKRIQRLLQK